MPDNESIKKIWMGNHDIKEKTTGMTDAISFLVKLFPPAIEPFDATFWLDLYKLNMVLKVKAISTISNIPLITRNVNKL